MGKYFAGENKKPSVKVFALYFITWFFANYFSTSREKTTGGDLSPHDYVRDARENERPSVNRTEAGDGSFMCWKRPVFPQRRWDLLRLAARERALYPYSPASRGTAGHRTHAWSPSGTQKPDHYKMARAAGRTMRRRPCESVPAKRRSGVLV